MIELELECAENTSCRHWLIGLQSIFLNLKKKIYLLFYFIAQNWLLRVREQMEINPVSDAVTLKEVIDVSCIKYKQRQCKTRRMSF